MSTPDDGLAAEKLSGETSPVNKTLEVESKLSENGHSDTDIDPAAEKRLLWKLDLTIYPVLYVVYMMSFLDRINISNARIQGLTADLNLVGNRFNIALFVSRLAPYS
jgi:hypothetical protein